MNKKVLVVIIIVVVIAAAVGAYLLFSSGSYSQYSKAFDNTFAANSMELDTSVKAVLDDGTSISSSGNFKLKNMNTTPQFINTMTIGGEKITQFSDGKFVYTDDGSNKNKISLGDEPTPKQQERSSSDFSFEAYVSEFSGLLDASKIKQLNALEAVAEKYVDKISAENVSGGTKYIVTLLPQAVDELVDNFLNENLSDKNMSPTVTLNAITYSATVSSGYVSEVAFKIDMDVIAPGESTVRRAVVDFAINPVNPGKSVSFDLPDTAGY